MVVGLDCFKLTRWLKPHTTHPDATMAEDSQSVASQTDSLIYQPLAKPSLSGQRLFRLLRILPDRRSEILRCELEVTDLADASPFEALSYVWGKPEPAKVVICSGHPKKVTPNLEPRRIGSDMNIQSAWYGSM